MTLTELRHLVTRRLLGVLLVGAVAAAALSLASAASAFELWSDDTGARSVSAGISLKWTSLLSRAPGDTVLYPEEWSASSLWRFRAVLDARPADWLSAQAAYEHRSRLVSEGSGSAGSGVLPSEFPVPYRIEQLDEPLVEVGETFSHRHELDRAFVTVSLARTELTLGRQAVGWGRGLFFGAVDVFAPFSPLESDREWRRGIDAARARVRLTDLISLDVVAALGESASESAYVARVHGYVGAVDGEVVGGVRRQDHMFGATVSFPVLDAEVHAEAAAFARADAGFEPFASSSGADGAVKALVGASRTFDVMSGLMILGEYHYSGFGLEDVSRADEMLEDPDYLERFIMGDTQLLGRHACAVQLSYGFAGVTPLSLSWIMSPVDGSGVVIPSVVWVFSDSVTLTGNAYIPHGASPRDGVLRSEYGGTPAGGLLQLSFYY